MKTRKESVHQFWDRSNQLGLTNKNYKNFLGKFLHLLLEEDLRNSDVTTSSLIKKNKRISAEFIAKEDGIFAGCEEFSFLNKELNAIFLKNDASPIRKGDDLIRIEGDAGKILANERLSLNLLQRMSGIATLTHNLGKKLGHGTRLAATRKTLWGSLDKKAVSVGGGLTHRLGLSDGILIKDNHLSILGLNIENAITMTKNKSKYVEIEVENKNQALSAAKSIKKIIKSAGRGCLYAIMLDNIPSIEIKNIVDELKKRNFYGSVLLEASGKINQGNLPQYSDCGVDIASMGCLTHSAKVLDISMDVVK